MVKQRGSLTLFALGIAVLVAVAVAAPAGAQIHQFGKTLVGAQGGMTATTQGGSGSPNGDKNSTRGTCSCAECIYLDTYDPTNPQSGDLIASTTTTLQKGVPYLITIKGTYAVWPASWWVGSGQGAVEAAPQYPSPGAVNGRVVADWEYLFGWYAPTPVLTLPVHLPFQGISLDGGITYNDYVPLGGQIYASSHVYQYLVEGQGGQAFFKKHDYPTNDNYGQFKICVQKLVPCGSIKDDNGGGDDGNPGGHS